jgi:predicted RNase H-like HicB family nuclease
MLTIVAFIEKFGDSLYLGSVPKFKGLFVQANSLDDIKRELIISVKVMIAYETGLDISKIEAEEIKSIKELRVTPGNTKNEYNFEFAL